MKKNRLLLILLFLIIAAVSIFAAYQRFFNITPEEILDEIKEIGAYTTDVSYTAISSRGEVKYDTTQWYDKTQGTKIEFKDGRINLYKENKIYIKDINSNRQYEMDKDSDQFYKLAFMDEIRKYIVLDNEIKYYYKDINGIRYLMVEFSMLNGNENMDKQLLIIDSENRVPKELIIYDKKGSERGKIVYSNFKKLKNVDKKLFEI
ncbi:germination lipoprotein GerS-related protein [Clostridium sp. C8-1-8]|uniref:germination lipoprotein GerS-related protein n=1 Tax=Clostridium sp. C8-1-8 TaxID=2698831 RepID=UPI00136E970E|nr:germination lipoprotein GerS-related protein [Clostridium sp. C8-1-8]